MTSSAWGFSWGDALWGSGTEWQGAAAIEVGELDYQQSALDRLWKQLEGRPNWEAIMRLFGDLLQESETVLAQLLTDRYLANAEGVTLTEIGYAFGTARGPFTDDDLYRTAVYVDAATLVSSGTIPELIDLGQRIAPEGEIVSVHNLGTVKHARMTITGLSADVYQALTVLLADVPAAGTHLLFESYDTANVAGWASVHGGASPTGAWSSTYGGADVLALWSHAQNLGS